MKKVYACYAIGAGPRTEMKKLVDSAAKARAWLEARFAGRGRLHVAADGQSGFIMIPPYGCQAKFHAVPLE